MVPKDTVLDHVHSSCSCRIIPRQVSTEKECYVLAHKSSINHLFLSNNLRIVLRMQTMLFTA